jgi:hypothetical protein
LENPKAAMGGTCTVFRGWRMLRGGCGRQIS